MQEITVDFGKGMEHIKSIGNSETMVINSTYLFDCESTEHIPINELEINY
jgi:hypothetical protein